MEQVFQKYVGDADHAAHVSQLALSMFYQLQPLHTFGEKYAGILHAAAMLHDIGHFIAEAKHHKHSYYLIKSSGLESFNKLELELIANIARYHRKAHPSPKHLGFSQLSPANQGVVRKLSALLRVADALDFKRAAAVKSVACDYNGAKTLNLACSASENIAEEIQWALEKGKLVEEVYNVKFINRTKPLNLNKTWRSVRRQSKERNTLFLDEDNGCLSQMAYVVQAVEPAQGAYFQRRQQAQLNSPTDTKSDAGTRHQNR